MSERRSAVVALGMFDGMHAGHRELIKRCVKMAEQKAAAAAVYSFSNHPQTVLTGESPKSLMNTDERRRVMESLGIQDVRLDEFTRELADLPPRGFIEKLNAVWRLRAVVAGYNYSFGRHGAGTPETLRELGKEYGFAVEIVEPVMYDGEPVSSTRIRGCVERGDMQAAFAMLSAPYTLSGTVIQNRQFGRTIDFPTANIGVEPDRTLPREGVYGTEATVEGRRFNAVTNVGSNPTVGGTGISIETHLIGFSGDLYGKRLSVAFLKRLRGEVRFASIDALKAQIARDVEAAKQDNI